MTGYKGKFQIKWWPWYLVDLRDWHNPHIVRKHFETFELADFYAKRVLGPEFEPIRGYKALEMGLSAGLNKKKKHRHKTRDFSKYIFPDWCKTQEDKSRFRTRQRRKLKRMKRIPELTNEDLYQLLEGSPSRFCIRTKIWRNWEYAYSIPSNFINRYIELYKWPKHVNICTIIEKTLIHYNYDIGIWPMWMVVRDIYDGWHETIEKFHNGWARSDYWVYQEFRARGFTQSMKLPNNNVGVIQNKDGLGWKYRWSWPEYGWLTNEGKSTTTEYIYTLQALVGVMGYTKVQLSKKYNY